MGWFSDKSSTDHVIHLYCQSRGVRRIFVGGGGVTLVAQSQKSPRSRPSVDNLT